MPENHQDLDIRSEVVQEILTQIPHWMIRWGNLLFLVLILLVLGLSWFIKYPDKVVSEAVITTEVPPQKEYAKVNGKIEVIFVTDNQQVQRNTPLAILENTANYQDIFKLRKIVDTLTVTGKSFFFPIDALETPALGEVETQYALFETAYMQYVLNKQLRPFSNESTANLAAISETSHRLENLKSQRVIKEKELALAETNLNRQMELLDQGVISTQDYENQQLQYAQAELSFKNYEASVSQLNETLSNARKALRGTEINRINEEAALLKNVLQSFSQLKRSIKDWERQYVLKSNIDGNVSFLNFWNINQTVQQGDLVFSIIPADYRVYLGKLKTPARNSGKIEIGQRVNVMLDNYSEVEFGVLQGRVEHVSALPDKEGFYVVDVSLPDRLITTYETEIAFKQEMRGTAEIITEDLRLIERTLFYVMNIFKNT